MGELRKDIIVAILAGGLAFVGAVGGSWFAARLDQSNWEDRMEYEWHVSMVERRSNLLERTARIINRSDEALSYGQEMAVAAWDTPSPEVLVKVIEARRARAELTSEFATVLSLDRTFFCQRTKHAVSNFVQAMQSHSNWWSVPDSVKSQLLNAMAEELVIDPRCPGNSRPDSVADSATVPMENSGSTDDR